MLVFALLAFEDETSLRYGRYQGRGGGANDSNQKTGLLFPEEAFSAFSAAVGIQLGASDVTDTHVLSGS